MAALEEALNSLIERDLTVGEQWITDEELLASPGLVKTMSVRPPRGRGRVRLVRITDGAALIDLQPCGGSMSAARGEDRPCRDRQDREQGPPEPPGRDHPDLSGDRCRTAAMWRHAPTP